MSQQDYHQSYSRQPSVEEIMLQLVIQFSKQFRSAPSNQYCHNVASYMALDLKLTQPQALKVLEASVNKFTHFPAIAELGQVWASVKAEMGDKLSRGKRDPSYVHSDPWPRSLIGLLSGFDDPRGVSPSGLKTLSLDPSEAFYLYGKWKEAAWDDAWAIELIERSRARTVDRDPRGIGL